MIRGHRILVVVVAAAGLFAATAIALPSAPAPAPSSPVGVGALAVDHQGDLGSAIAAAQARLARLPGDWSTWAQLGSADVQQARITADPSYYPKAEGALQQSLKLRSVDNWQAMVGEGALANARHDFASALRWGRQAAQINPYSGTVYGVIVDALTQLGDYPGARDALQHMLDVAPGVSSFTRASYDLELHGQVDQARDALSRALDQAAEPADMAFCYYYLGELAFNNGDPTQALARYQDALTADPNYQQAYAGLGKAEAALGRLDDAIASYDRAVRALPLPNLLVEYGDVLAAAGRPTAAQQQYDLVATEQALFAANGVADHLGAATFFADHGQPGPALTEATAEWAARHNVLTADAMAWALHRNDRDADALPYAEMANELGWRNATLLYHRGAIHAALGQREQARADLGEALAVNPSFDPMQAAVARQLLSTVNGP